MEMVFGCNERSPFERTPYASENISDFCVIDIWCPGPELNRHGPVKVPQDFKSCASTNFATGAFMSCEYPT